MSNIWTRAWASTPKIDCGLCGRGTCAGFARALLAGWLELSMCPILNLDDFTNMRAELVSIMKRSPSPRRAPEMPKGGILLTKPCKDTNDRVMAELRFVTGVEFNKPIHFGTFDAMILCDLLECLSDELESVRCSRDLGYGRADTNEMNITFLQDGRINMRRVLDQQSVENLFHSLERALFGATICNSCGKDLLTIMWSGTPSLEEGQHTILQGGSGFSIDREVAQQPLHRNLALRELGSDGGEIVTAFDQAFFELRQDIEKNRKGEREVSKNSSLKLLKCAIVKRLYSNSSQGKESVLLKLLAYLNVIHNAFQGLIEIGQEMKHCDETEREVANEIIDLLTKDNIFDIRREGFTSRLIIIYAHAMRVNHALQLESFWSS